MTVILVSVIGIVAFLSGFGLGLIKRPDKKITEREGFGEVSAELSSEYRNFLSYDGSEQY